MVRLLLWFVAVFVVMQVLSAVPVLGRLFHIPFLGFMLAAVVVGFLGERLSRRLVSGRRLRSLERSLGGVDTPHNQGKLGALLVSQGRHRRALVPLERAIAGEPDVPEWHYRAGVALLGLGRAREAATELERAAELDEEYGFGSVLMRLAEAKAKQGEDEAVLATLARFERNHGPNPESAYRLARALRRLGRKDQAPAAFTEVLELAGSSVRYQRGASFGWALRARLQRLVL